jgi:hypothetical protein
VLTCEMVTTYSQDVVVELADRLKQEFDASRPEIDRILSSTFRCDGDPFLVFARRLAVTIPRLESEWVNRKRLEAHR